MNTQWILTNLITMIHEHHYHAALVYLHRFEYPKVQALVQHHHYAAALRRLHHLLAANAAAYAS